MVGFGFRGFRLRVCVKVFEVRFFCVLSFICIQFAHVSSSFFNVIKFFLCFYLDGFVFLIHITNIDKSSGTFGHIMPCCATSLSHISIPGQLTVKVNTSVSGC